MQPSRRARLDARERELLEQIQSLKDAYTAWVRPIAEELWLLRQHRDGCTLSSIDGQWVRCWDPHAEYYLPEERH